MVNTQNQRSLSVSLLLDRIAYSATFEELRTDTPLPEPYDDSGFYYMYYAETDYREALADIVRWIDDGMRIYYDRHYENGQSWRHVFISKCKSLHCRLVVFFISAGVFDDITFIELCRTVYRNKIPYVSINLSTDGIIKSGEQMLAEGYGSSLSDDDQTIMRKLFANEITYIPGTFDNEEKRNSLEKAYGKSTFIFEIHDGYAVLDHVRDITEEEISVPEKVLLANDEYVVKAIAPNAFKDCENLRSLSLPSTIETIGVPIGEVRPDIRNQQVFYRCRNLTEIVFPPSVKLLASGCFYGCSSLKRIVLNDGLSFCGEAALIFCFSDFVDANVIDANLVTREMMGELVNGYLFNEFEREEHDDYDEPKLEYLRLPSTVRRISKTRYVTHIDGRLCGLDLPECECIEGYEANPIESDYYVRAGDDISFLHGLKRLERVTFDPEWQDAEDFSMTGALRNCACLKEVVLPKHIVALQETFKKCTALASVILPEELTCILDFTFAQCESLEELRIPEEVMYVGRYAFKGCTKLKTLILEGESARNVCNADYTYRAAMLFEFGFNANSEVEKHVAHFIVALTSSCIDTLYTKVKTDIPLFGQVDSDRNGYFKYVRKTVAK